MGNAIELKILRHSPTIKSVAFVNRNVSKSFTNKSTSGCDFRREIFYRRFKAINSSVDFIYL